jgi:ribosome recycling factor
MLELIYKEIKEKMQAVMDMLRSDFSSIRTGRANITILEKVKISCYNTTMPLNQVATITVSDPRLIIIQPWDKGLVSEIEKGILTSDLGLSPANDGNVIRVPVPPLSTERRQELIKIIRKKAEDGKVAIRNVRRDANDKVKKLEGESSVSEDEARLAHEQTQEVTDEFIVEIDVIMKNKEKEVMQI